MFLSLKGALRVVLVLRDLHIYFQQFRRKSKFGVLSGHRFGPFLSGVIIGVPKKVGCMTYNVQYKKGCCVGQQGRFYLSCLIHGPTEARILIYSVVKFKFHLGTSHPYSNVVARRIPFSAAFLVDLQFLHRYVRIYPDSRLERFFCALP